MLTKDFLISEYKKACKRGRYHYAWVILQNLQRYNRQLKQEEKFSNLYINEDGHLQRGSN